MRKLYEIFNLLWIQKRIVAAATIWGNTVCQQAITQKIFIHANLNLGPDETDYSYLIDKKVWVDGTESHTFNELENIALSKHARTPILGCLVSDALAGEIVQVWKYK